MVEPYPYDGHRRAGDTAVHVEIAGIKLVFVKRMWEKMAVFLGQHAIGDNTKQTVALLNGEMEEGELGWISDPPPKPAKPAARVVTTEPPPTSLDNEGDLEEDEE